MDHAAQSLFSSPTLPREEALARAAENDAAYRRSLRERGELLIDPRHLELAAKAVDCCASPVCGRPVSSTENLVVDLGRGLVWHAGCR
jgi:hypothetical protein